jgi:hypothetical protein
MTDIVERLRLKNGMEFPDPMLFADALLEIERHRRAINDIWRICTSQNNYGPHGRGRVELSERLSECRSICMAVSNRTEEYAE